MSNVAQIILQHLDKKERAKERREDKLLDIFKIAEAREYQESIRDDAKELARKTRNLDSLEREIVALKGNRKVQEKLLQDSNVSLDLVNDLFKTNNTIKVIEDTALIDFENDDDLTSNYENQIYNLNLEIENNQSVISNNLKQVNNIIEGGALAINNGGVGTGTDPLGLDVGDFGQSAYDEIYKRPIIDTSGMSDEEIKSLNDKMQIEDSIIANIFDNTTNEQRDNFVDEQKRLSDVYTQETKDNYYAQLTEKTEDDKDLVKASMFEKDIRGYIRNSNSNLQFDQYVTLSSMTQSQIDEQDAIKGNKKVADKIGDIQSQLGIAFIKTQGLEEDFLEFSTDEQLTMVGDYFDIYQDIVISSNAKSEARVGETVKSNLEDYYVYAKAAYDNYLQELDPKGKEDLEALIRKVYGVPKLQTIDGFYKALDLRFEHISETYDEFSDFINADPATKDKLRKKATNDKNRNLINILKNAEGND